uniref:Uncharacterized protein n=1 Tax=Arundo donax TaxID=35708 RepID=A0A0A9FJK0_ARUDO
MAAVMNGYACNVGEVMCVRNSFSRIVFTSCALSQTYVDIYIQT